MDPSTSDGFFARGILPSQRRRVSVPNGLSKRMARFGELVSLLHCQEHSLERCHQLALNVDSSLSLSLSLSDDPIRFPLCRIENIRDRPPTADEWWEDVGAPDTIDVYRQVEDDKTGSGKPKVVIKSHVSSCHKKFHNCGFEVWVRSREEWKQRTVEDIPERPALVERAQIVKGLRKATSQRTYELPRNVGLSDLIHMYSDIWDGGH